MSKGEAVTKDGRRVRSIFDVEKLVVDKKIWLFVEEEGPFL